MKPYLTLSTAPEQDSLSRPAKPRELHATLTSTTLSTLERLDTISAEAAKLVHADMDKPELVRYLAGYRKAVNVLKPQLDNQLVGLMLPPNSEDIEFNRHCGGLYSHLAAVCKRIILDSPDDLLNHPESTVSVTEACYWGIMFLGDALRYAYSSYIHAPDDVWFEIHQIYQFSVSEGIEKLKITVDDSKRRTVEHAYKRVLLFGICDPYHFPFRSVHGVFKGLDDWAKLVEISDTPRNKERCSFLINPNADKPAMPLLPNASFTEGEDVLYIDTANLVKILNRDLNTSLRQTMMKGQTKERVAKELDNRELLKKLIVSWGIHPVRESDRRATDAKCDLAVGLRSVCGLLGVIGREDNSEDQFIRRGLELVDQSEDGARISVSANDRTHVRVGELVAYKNQRRVGGWCIGMIRWAQMDSQNKFYAGVYKFLDNALPVEVSHILLKDEQPFSQPTSGIWTVRRKGQHQVPSVIVDTSFYKPNESIKIERGSVRHLFETRDVILSSRWFIWLELSLSSTTPERTLELLVPSFDA